MSDKIRSRATTQEYRTNYDRIKWPNDEPKEKRFQQWKRKKKKQAKQSARLLGFCI